MTQSHGSVLFANLSGICALVALSFTYGNLERKDEDLENLKKTIATQESLESLQEAQEK